MMMKNKIAVVTGAGGDLGSAICMRLAEEGATLVLTLRKSEEQTRALASSLPGSDHLVIRARVDESDSLERLASEIEQRYGTVDLLVNNAGITRSVPHDDLDSLDDELIDDIFRTNWRGAFACIRSLKNLLSGGAGGVVVNISSIAGVTGIGSNVAYCASKAALNSMTISLARALAPQVRVVSVSPGWVSGKIAATMPREYVQEQVDKTPLGKLATPRDVADAVLAVTLLHHTTGSIIPVDGGRPFI